MCLQYQQPITAPATSSQLLIAIGQPHQVLRATVRPQPKARSPTKYRRLLLLDAMCCRPRGQTGPTTSALTNQQPQGTGLIDLICGCIPGDIDAQEVAPKLLPNYLPQRPQYNKQPQRTCAVWCRVGQGGVLCSGAVCRVVLRDGQLSHNSNCGWSLRLRCVTVEPVLVGQLHAHSQSRTHCQTHGTSVSLSPCLPTTTLSCVQAAAQDT